MSASRGSGAAGQPIPAGSRKVVQGLKEIVNCSEAEIYAALQDCNMDPNEAVNRLLSQDPFHEVKRKREKKKESKDATDSRVRGSSRGNKIGTVRYGGRGGSYNSSDCPLPGKSSYKKENGSVPCSSSLSSAQVMSGNSRSRGSAGLSNGAFAETGSSLLCPTDAMQPGGVEPTFECESPWMGAPGQMPMADIVKMGKPHNKASNVPNASNHNACGPSLSFSQLNLGFPEDNVSKEPESGDSSVPHVPTNDEWSTTENPTATKVISKSEYVVHSEQQLEASDVLSDSISQHCEAGEVHKTNEESIEISGANDVGVDSLSCMKIPEDDSGCASLLENDLYENMGSYQHEAPECHSDEEIGASVSSVTRTLQQLSIEKDDRGLSPEGCVPSVVIPDHLQVQIADCSHLSFGSFGSGMSAAYSSGTMTSVPVKPNLEESHAEADISSLGHLESRSSEYYVDDALRNASDDGMFRTAGENAGSFDTSASKPEDLKPEKAKVPHGNEHPFPSSNPGYSFDDAQHSNATFSQASSQIQSLAPFSNVLQSYTNSLPSTSSPIDIYSSRESVLQYSPFPVGQLMSAKDESSVSSIDGSATSTSEALKTAGISSTQPASHTLSGINVATVPPLPQNVAVHPYAQHTLPLGPFTSMIGYPLLAQSYTYMPSAFQQSFAGNNTYNQSLAALLPQYKNSASASSLAQSAAIASGFGAFGNATTIPRNFPMNPPAAPSRTTLSYDDVLRSLYKDSSHLFSLQQSENPAMWPQGPNSRMMSAVPAGTYHQGQNQQSGGLRQGQQPSQNYGVLGYPNFYHSQTGISLDQQLHRDGSLGGSQGQPKQPQIWQNSY